MENGKQTPNGVTLPPWRIDNAYSFLWALIISVVTATAGATATYYSILRNMDKQASESTTDIKLIKNDVAFIKEKISENAVLSEKKLDDHINSTASKIHEIDQLALKVAAIEAKLK